MQFTAYEPKPELRMFLGWHGWQIFGTGDIDAKAGERLAALIAEKQIPTESLIFLHSPGGSLMGGMALGRAIRAHRLRSYIGQFAFDERLEMPVSKPGVCYSSCALAFLGGEYRFWSDRSQYGVHRFYWSKPTDDDAGLAQIVSAAVVEYIRTMEVDTKLFGLGAQAGRDDILTPSREILTMLGVYNDGLKPPLWSIESADSGIYLKGQQDTANGINKFMLICASQMPMMLYVVYDAGQNAAEALSWPVHVLHIDKKTVRIDRQIVAKRNGGGMVNVFYRLTPALLNMIREASTVGVGLRVAEQSATFSGFDNMPFQAGAAKLSGFLKVCPAKR